MTARRALPQAPSRRGWCPSLSRPMPTGDGLLARVHPPLGILTPAQARAVAEGARRFGNGHVDATARANLQIRGVTEDTRAPLAAFLDAAGLGDIRSDGGPQRLTLTAPLAGQAVRDLARAIEAIGLAIPGLPAKALVSVEDVAFVGSGDGEADIRLCVLNDATAPVAERRALRIAMALAGPDGPEWFTAAEPLEAAGLALRTLAASGVRRMRDLPAGERSRLIADLRPTAVATPAAAAPRLRCGIGDLGDGRTALLLDAPFGRCDSGALHRLADAAEALASDIHLSPTRGFALAGTDAGALRRARDVLTGFVTEPDDPRGAVAACPGAPACASGSTPTLDHAARLAQAFGPFAARGLRGHVSGCAKGCAHPQAADLTLVGNGGLYGIVIGGAPSDLPAMQLTFEAALERLRRADPALPLERAFRIQP
ncbi:hypothetical protein [Methylobacterium sp. Leaf108]|uniref:hypothetical protein n=1 Tax=Methylobacterium sp. Leaf108 TaxID=1736256 RepID=UPI0006FB3578|nr:hypothetical protein [Methylobacterium sp. Leaf108]KQP61199.1 hypothetical protein ASF39_00360 [Methylobacterium sp. Leaf108]